MADMQILYPFLNSIARQCTHALLCKSEFGDISTTDLSLSPIHCSKIAFNFRLSACNNSLITQCKIINCAIVYQNSSLATP